MIEYCVRCAEGLGLVLNDMARRCVLSLDRWHVIAVPRSSAYSYSLYSDRITSLG